MIPGKYDITLQRGSNFKLTFTAKDSAGDINFGSLYTGARLQVRPPWVSSQEEIVGAPLFSMTTASGTIVISGLTVVLALTAEQTKAMNFTSGSYLLELYYVNVAEQVDPFMEGLFTVRFERTI